MVAPVLGEWAMASQRGYGQFCPVAMATEVLGTRWTILVLRELICGSTRFNELRRGVPRMSPALLSKRLTELEAHGLISRSRGADSGAPVYRLTQAGEELRPVIMSLGSWGQRWLESQLSLRNLDPSLLMWDMRRNLKPDALPERRITIQFLYPKLERGQRKWWLVVDKTAAHGPVDLCMLDPGHEPHCECPRCTIAQCTERVSPLQRSSRVPGVHGARTSFAAVCRRAPRSVALSRSCAWRAACTSSGR